MESERYLAYPQPCHSLSMLTFKTSWAARPPMKAFMGARSPAATYASFRMRSSSRLSCCTPGRARAFTARAKVTSSAASSWWGRSNQKHSYQATVGKSGQGERHARLQCQGHLPWLAHPYTHLIVGPRGLAVLSTELVQSLESNMQLSRAGILGKVRHHKLGLYQ